MFTQLSETTSYPVKNLSKSTSAATVTTVSKPGFFKKLAQRQKTKGLQNELELEGELAGTKKNKFDSLTQPYLEVDYIKVSISKY